VAAVGGCLVRLAKGDVVHTQVESSGLVMHSTANGIGRKVRRYNMQPDHAFGERLAHAAKCAATCAADAAHIQRNLLNMPRVVMTTDAAADLAAKRRSIVDMTLRLAESVTALATFAQDECGDVK
jgi:hypothetical protein